MDKNNHLFAQTMEQSFEEYCHISYKKKNASEFLQYSFSHINEIKPLTLRVCRWFPDSQKAIFGLTELMVNAIEHGNLGISYEEKVDLVKSGSWLSEIHKRLCMPSFKKKRALLQIQRSESDISVSIMDQGNGFDWHAYLNLSPGRKQDVCGRGIALVRRYSFPHLSFWKDGREAVFMVSLKSAMNEKSFLESSSR